jgi:hypothetical protein
MSKLGIGFWPNNYPLKSGLQVQLNPGTSGPFPLSLFLSSGTADRANAAALRQVFAGDEHPPGMPDPSPPFLLLETEHPKP